MNELAVALCKMCVNCSSPKRKENSSQYGNEEKIRRKVSAQRILVIVNLIENANNL